MSRVAAHAETLIAARLKYTAPRLVHAVPCYRTYATQTSLGNIRPSEQAGGRRKAITPFNDDGRVPWGQLSPAEKVSRTAQQSFNFTLIAGGLVATVAVFTLLYTDLFSPNSHITQYNHAVDRVRASQECQDILGPGKSISALGPATGSNWRRVRPKAQVDTDKFGTQRMHMHIGVKGDKNEGAIELYMVRRADEGQWNWGHLALDVRGHERVWLERPGQETKKEPGTFLGIKWR